MDCRGACALLTHLPALLGVRSHSPWPGSADESALECCRSRGAGYQPELNAEESLFNVRRCYFKMVLQACSFRLGFLPCVKLSPFLVKTDLEAHFAGQLLLVENFRFLLFGTQSSRSSPFPHSQGTLMSLTGIVLEHLMGFLL